MINTAMQNWGSEGSVIRAIYAYGQERKKEIGAENVFNFSQGSPNVPAPASINETYIRLLASRDDLYLHGYTAAPGDPETRSAIASDLNQRFGTHFTTGNLYLTNGASSSIRISLTAIVNPGDEVIVFKPFFPEYQVFIESSGAVFRAIDSDPADFQIDFDLLEAAINENTKAILINSPNNPTGVVLRESTVQKLADLLRSREQQYGHAIYLISDEPYRELIYDENLTYPFVTSYYNDSIVCYSYSKSLSLPGERIGYILIPSEAADFAALYAAVCGAARALGYICAPSLAQHVIASCAGDLSDLSVYKTNRDLLYSALTSCGFHCVHPDGAFYLFVQSPEEDAKAFAEKAKEFEILIVPADTFGAPGYVRIAYCVTTEQIRNSLPAFQKLAKRYGLTS